MNRIFLVAFAVAASAQPPSTPAYEQAKAAYQRTDYTGTLRIMAPVEKDAKGWALVGMASFGATDYKRATESFEKAVELAPNNSEYVHWLGRCWGRRAETGSPFTAPTYAVRARTNFEKAVALDPSNKEALNDLFDYYLEAPGFLGGGMSRAEALVDPIARLDPAEGYYARAQLADKRKQYDEAEKCLRRALELAPRQVGRLIDLAKYAAKRGRPQESDQYFARAEKLTPDNPRLLFERASIYIHDNRNLDEARTLLKRYLRSSLTPDDPPREKAEELLKKAGA